jgi:RNA polymerase sigma-70 factor, ECF subfamily
MAPSQTAEADCPVIPQAPAREREALNEDNFAAIYEEHARAIYYLALRLLGDSARAEDAAHDVFLKAFRGMKEFRHAADVRTWLYRIAINHCQNLRQTWHQRNVRTTLDGTLDDGPAAARETPFRVAEAKELGRQIQIALDALPEEYRLLLLLVADDELTYQEVATLTSQSADAVRGKLHRARKAFAAVFNHKG